MRKREGSTGYGYETRGGDKVTAFRDMIDGGGAGRSGDEFEGGGLFSLLANLFASPYGSNRERAAGIIEGPTRPRTRPAPPFGTSGTSGTSGTAVEQGSPNYTPPGTPVQRGAYRKYGPPGTAVERGAYRKFGPPALTASETLMGRGITFANNVDPTPTGEQEDNLFKYVYAPSVEGFSMPDFAPTEEQTPSMTASEEVMSSGISPMSTALRSLQPTYAFDPNNSRGIINGQMPPQEFPTPPPISMGSMMALLETVLTPNQMRELEKFPPHRRMDMIERLMQINGL